MLQKLDEHSKRLLDLADHIEKSETFNMREWCNCIAGHAVRLFGEPSESDYDCSERARQLLWLDDIEAHDLFCPSDGNNPPEVRLYSREQAASALRHLAITGEIKFPDESLLLVLAS